MGGGFTGKYHWWQSGGKVEHQGDLPYRPEKPLTEEERHPKHKGCGGLLHFEDDGSNPPFGGGWTTCSKCNLKERYTNPGYG